jgi:hypothetical protein
LPYYRCQRPHVNNTSCLGDDLHKCFITLLHASWALNVRTQWARVGFTNSGQHIYQNVNGFFPARAHWAQVGLAPCCQQLCYMLPLGYCSVYVAIMEHTTCHIHDQLLCPLGSGVVGPAIVVYNAPCLLVRAYLGCERHGCIITLLMQVYHSMFKPTGLEWGWHSCHSCCPTYMPYDQLLSPPGLKLMVVFV